MQKNHRISNKKTLLDWLHLVGAVLLFGKAKNKRNPNGLKLFFLQRWHRGSLLIRVVSKNVYFDPVTMLKQNTLETPAHTAERTIENCNWKTNRGNRGKVSTRNDDKRVEPAINHTLFFGKFILQHNHSYNHKSRLPLFCFFPLFFPPCTVFFPYFLFEDHCQRCHPPVRGVSAAELRGVLLRLAQGVGCGWWGCPQAARERERVSWGGYWGGKLFFFFFLIV